ncbi:MAG: hypothetical protein ACR2PS_08300, partial [Pseudomonadales bacterium]
MKTRASNPNSPAQLTTRDKKIPVRGRYKRMLKTQNKLLSENVHRRARKEKQHTVSKKTQHNRRVIINAAFDTLFLLGFHLENVYNFTVKHERVLIEHWTTREKPLEPKTLCLYIS